MKTVNIPSRRVGKTFAVAAMLAAIAGGYIGGERVHRSPVPRSRDLKPDQRAIMLKADQKRKRKNKKRKRDWMRTAFGATGAKSALRRTAWW